MKKLFIIALVGITSFAFSELHTWDFVGTDAIDASISDTGVRLSGSVGSVVEGWWTQATTIGDAASGGTSGGGSVFLGSNQSVNPTTGAAGNSAYLGPVQGFTRGADQIEYTVTIANIDFDGVATSNTDFGFALTDSENTTGSNRHWLGISVFDLYGNNRINAALKGSNISPITLDANSGAPSGGHAGDTSVNGRKSFHEVTSNGNLTYAGPITLGLNIDFNTDTWVTSVNGVSQGSGTFDGDDYAGVDGIQTRLANFEAGDYVELTGMTLNVIPEPATLSFLGVAGSGLLLLRRKFSSVSS